MKMTNEIRQFVSSLAEKVVWGLKEFVSELDSYLDSAHFIVIYRLRNPREGQGDVRGDVRSIRLVQSYLHSLERAYEFLTNPPWQRETPPVCEEFRKTVVFVFDLSQYIIARGGPVTLFNKDGIPFICLPSQIDEPTSTAALQYATAAAVHEGVHALNCSQRAYGGLSAERWRWFEEAFCVYMESFILGSNPDHFRYLAEWHDRPDLSLDGGDWVYRTCMFVHYLARRFGLQFLNSVWEDSEEDESPLEAVDRLRQEEGFEEKNSGHEISLKGLFERYCLDCYFVLDPNSTCFCPDVCVRYGGMALTHSHTFKNGKPFVHETKLDHLAAHYFRFYVTNDAKNIRFSLKADSQKDGSSDLPNILGIQVVSVTPELRRKDIKISKARNDSGIEFVADISDPSAKDFEYILLIISNSGSEEKRDDNIRYALSVAAS